MKFNKKLNAGKIVNPDLFSCRDYKVYLKARIETSEGSSIRTKLCKVMGTPNSFLSQVLHDSTHLSQDHGIKLANHWRLNADEKQYFLTLINLARAGSMELRAYLEKELEDLRLRQIQITQRLQAPVLSKESARWEYYSAWYHAVIHLMTAIPEFQNVQGLARVLRLPTETIQNSLYLLDSLGLVNKSGSRWFITQNALHLEKGSSISNLNHSLWRQKIAEKIMTRPNPQDLHYTGVHVLSTALMEQIGRELVDSIQKIHTDIRQSKDETAAILSIDWIQASSL